MNIHTTRWDEERIQTAVDLWKGGSSQTQIGEHMGISRNAVAAMIYRNRTRFAQRGCGNSTTQPVGEARPNGLRKGVFHWNETALNRASKMWTEGMRAAEIAATLGVNERTFLSVTNRFRGRFPTRTRASSRQRKAPVEMRDFIVDEAAEKYDLTKFQIAGTASVPFVDLSSRQCHFPLEAFEAVSGPATPCCGQQSEEGRSYCSTHLRVMRQQR